MMWAWIGMCVVCLVGGFVFGFSEGTGFGILEANRKRDFEDKFTAEGDRASKLVEAVKELQETRSFGDKYEAVMTALAEYESSK